MDIEKVIEVCRKNGVKKFTCPEFSFELSDIVPTPTHNEPVGTESTDSSSVPTDDEFLFMATPHYETMMVAKEILKQPPEPK